MTENHSQTQRATAFSVAYLAFYTSNLTILLKKTNMIFFTEFFFGSETAALPAIVQT